MSESIALWTREAPTTTGRQAEVVLVVFAGRPLAEDVPLSAKRFGLPSRDAAEHVELQEIERQADPDWFDNWRTGALASIAKKDLGDDFAALEAADRLGLVIAKQTDPADFGYLQASWALARWCVARGATTVLDAHAARYSSAAAIAARPADEPFDVEREVTLIYETDATEKNQGHCLHTRGMRKLGCPDIVSVVGSDDAALVGEVIRQLSEALAQGFLPTLPRHGVDLPDGRILYLIAPRADDPADRLELNNDAFMLVTESGEHLVGLSTHA